MCSDRYGPARETDLYRPLRDYLEAHGYIVRSEVRGCDVVAERDGEIVVLELKRNLSVSLLVQAVDRQRAFGSVYVALPHPGEKARTREWHAKCRLLKRLELGLILVDLGLRSAGHTPVDVVFHPLPPQRRAKKDVSRAILTELRGRSADLNEAGSTRRKIVTAYRENAVQIGCCLEALGPLTPGELRKMDTGAKTASILAKNFYGWFERVGPGLYALTGRGAAEIQQYPELVAIYARRAAGVAATCEEAPR